MLKVVEWLASGRQRRGCGPRSRARWVLPITAALFATGAVAVWQAALPRPAHVEPKAPRLVFELHGPNDGEPINSRYVTLDVATNYPETGTISVHVNGGFLFRRPLAVNPRPDGRPDIYRTDVDVDLEEIYRLVDPRIFEPDAPPLRVTIYLYPDEPGPSRLLSFAEWSGYVGKPWMEFLTADYARDGGGGKDPLAGARLPTQEPETLQILIHPLPNDSYYFLLAATDRALLTRSPEDERLHRVATFISSGRCSLTTAISLRKVIHVDVAQDLPGPAAYLVLWTYDTYGGWKRSPIVLVRN